PSALLLRTRKLGASVRSTPYVTLLAAFVALLRRYTGQNDLMIGSPVSNRARLELESLIGLFINTVALRADASGDPSFRELLGRVRDVVLGAQAHAEVPFERIVEELRPERSGSRSPLFQVFFQLEHAAPIEASSLRAEGRWISSKTAKFDLSLQLIE